ncbi:hypothetical protein WR25_12367 [Diploscapter pachys]|uniref:Uncharacterized protein n=1 Tax=Diploscapter pachys TaxID=2018661 RepID=A0A2A2J9T6_9BILA|nr:hypothetical protein WR25_12367 [Diploscapter pachys]
MVSNSVIHLLVFTLLVVSATAVSFEDVLQTNQYTLISHQHCEILVEANLGDEKQCPLAANPEWSSPSDSECMRKSLRVALLPDIYSKSAPRMLVAMNQLSVNPPYFGQRPEFFIDHIPLLAGTNTSVKFNYLQKDDKSRKQIYLSSLTNAHTVEYLLYDHTTRFLYVLVSEPKQFLRCFIYIVDDFFETGHMIPYLMNFIINQKSQDRFNWVVDSYSGKVRYSVHSSKEDSKISVFELPIGRLFNALHEGEKGELALKAEENQVFVSTLGGITLFVESNPSSDLTIPFFRSHPGSKFELKCDRLRDRSSKTPLAIVRDMDYCLMKYGSTAEKETCDAERTAWLEKKGHLKSFSNFWTLFWLIFSVVLLTLVIVFLLCYICWLRRSFDSDLPPDPAQQPLRYYRNTQPHYQFNMDVSVDKFSTRRNYYN